MASLIDSLSLTLTELWIRACLRRTFSVCAAAVTLFLLWHSPLLHNLLLAQLCSSFLNQSVHSWFHGMRNLERTISWLRGCDKLVGSQTE